MRNAFIAAALAVVALALQMLSGAGESEFSTYPDEPAHYVTGLMFTEYVRQGFPASPVRFAEDYYLHYPKVAIGSWPPVFYMVLASWSLPFGSSKESQYVLIALITACTAFGVFWWSRTVVGATAAALLGLAYLLLPLTQELASMMMADSLVTLLTFCSVIMFARFWESKSYRDAIGFGILAGLTVLTKGSGVALALIPPCAIVFTRQWKLLRPGPLWAAAAIVAILGGPWTLLTLRIVQNGWQGDRGLWGYMLRALWEVPWMHVVNVTWPVAVLAVLGVGMLARSRERTPAILLSAGAAVTAVLVFHVLTPVGMENRRLLMAIPPTMILAGRGICWIAPRIGKGVAPVAAVLVAVVALYGLPPRQKTHYGYDQAALALGAAEWQGCVAMVSADIDGEGMLISELALREPKPSRYLLRATKMLASSRWSGEDYQVRYQTAAEVQRFLDESPVSVVVLDTFPALYGARKHHALLWEVVRDKDLWELAGEFRDPHAPAAGKIAMFRRRGKACVPNPRIEVDLRQKINREVHN